MLFNFPFYTEDGGLHQGDQLSHFSLSHPPVPDTYKMARILYF